MKSYMGKPTNRIDGHLKVTGAAKYAAEFSAPDLSYGVIVSSTIAKGRIVAIDAIEAMAAPGVLRVITHENRPQLAWFNGKFADEDSPPGHHFRPLENSRVVCSGQPIALVVAETFEAARAAAATIRVEYEVDQHATDLKAERVNGSEPKKGKSGWQKPASRGDAPKAIAAAAVKVEATYSLPTEHHNPMEMFASTVIWEGDGKLTIYDKTQGVMNSAQFVQKAFGLKADHVHVKSPFMGGGFGAGLRPQYQLPLAVMAAQLLQRSVRVVMTRQQMFSFGHRPCTEQTVKIGANEQGELQGIVHEAYAETSRFENYTEVVVNWSGLLYRCANVQQKYELVPLDVFTPLDMRAPGAATGLWALESAMDELAVKLKMDPLELRLKNYIDVDQTQHDRKFSTKELRQAYLQGAEKFGWSKRNPKPGSMREGRKMIGWGMASGVWDAMTMKAAVRLNFSREGQLTVSSAITDIGTGTYTVMAQVASGSLGLPIEKVRVKLGDSKLSAAPLQGGSWTAASLGSAIDEAAEKIKKTIFDAIQKRGEPLGEVKFEEIEFADETLRVKADPEINFPLSSALAILEEKQLEVELAHTPNMAKQALYSRNTHSAVFVEVKVDEDTGMVEVSRVVSAIAAGKILNPKTARSQILGGVVWGVSMALHEASLMDHHLGRFMNHSFAEYHIPVAKDLGEIEVIFVEEDDRIVSPLGMKGVGEIGVVGTAAAVANAIYHATGQRIRELPITPDRLMKKH